MRSKLVNSHGEPVKLLNSYSDFSPGYWESLMSTSDRFVPRKYTTYSQIVKAIRDRYNAESVLGSTLVQPAVQYRLSYLFGNGAVITARGKKEQKWINDFIDRNNINTLFLREGMLNGEIEGKNLMQLYVQDAQVFCRNISWSVTGYEVITDPLDYSTVIRVDFKNKQQRGLSLTPDEFVFVRHGGGTPDRINQPVPAIASCLFEMDAVSYALADLRRNNSKFGFSFIHFKTNNAQESEDLNTYLSAIKWQPGQAVSSTGDVQLVAPKLEAAQIFEKEIAMNLQAISTKTGVPLYVFDIAAFSNRAVAYEVKNATSTAMAQEKITWCVKIREMIQKAMRLANEADPSLRLRTEGLIVDIPSIDVTQMEQIQNVLLPMYDRKLISAKTIVDQLPETTYEDEQERLSAEQPQPQPADPVPQDQPQLQVVGGKK